MTFGLPPVFPLIPLPEPEYGVGEMTESAGPFIPRFDNEIMLSLPVESTIWISFGLKLRLVWPIDDEIASTEKEARSKLPDGNISLGDAAITNIAFP